MVLSIIIGLSRECFEYARLAVCLNHIRRSCFLVDGLTYEILLPYMYRDESELPAHVSGLIPVPVPKDGLFCKSLQCNFAIRKAEGTHVVITDVDTLWTKHAAHELNETIKGTPNSFIGCDIAYLRPMYYDHKAIFGGFAGSGDITSTTDVARKGQWMYGNIQCLPREVLFEMRGYDERMRVWGDDDNDLFLRAKQKVEPVSLAFPVYHLWHEKRYCEADGFGFPRDEYTKRNTKFREDSMFTKNCEDWGTLRSDQYV